VSLHVVLVHPEIPQNTGNVARTCAAVGAELHLVHPLGFQITERAVRRAGLDYWHLVNVREHRSFAQLVQTIEPEKAYLFSSKGTTVYSDIIYATNPWLLFGGETRGLPEEVLDSAADRLVRIPTVAEARCLNLSNAVAIAVYEVLRQQGYTGLKTAGGTEPRR
jgi:tRNA (cytidine/uridine-2'-O-)-methyltransferase